MVKPLCSDPVRVKERRFIRARARGLSASASAIHAGYSKGHAYLLQRRLAGEVAHERAKLTGHNGGTPPAEFGRVDAQRIIPKELAAIHNEWAKPHLKEQRLRTLAAQIKTTDAREALIRLWTRHKRAGGSDPEIGALISWCRRLIAECEARDGLRPPSTGGRAYGETPQQPPEQPVMPACPKHPSQPLNRCRLCAGLRQMAPTRDALGGLRFPGDVDADELPATYGTGDPTW